jgi:hypothetical protein
MVVEEPGRRPGADSPTLPFRQVAPGVGGGEPAPAGWRSIAGAGVLGLPLVVLVGGSGVGKTTTLAALRRTGRPWTALPDRRLLTGAFVLAAAGLPADLPRAGRQAAVAAFRQRFPGGMAEILARLHIDPARLAGPLVFDGLRGVAEVAHATTALPCAFFALLEAPRELRARRLLGRDDPHDRPPGAARLDEAAVAALLDREERAHDSVSVLRELRRSAPGRHVVIATAACPPAEVVRRLAATAGLWEDVHARQDS